MRPAAAPHDQHVGAGGAAHQADGARDLLRRALALHARGGQHDARPRRPPADHGDDVAQRRAGRRGDDPHARGVRRERPLAARAP